jgi:hypothetical protein
MVAGEEGIGRRDREERSRESKFLATWGTWGIRLKRIYQKL